MINDKALSIFVKNCIADVIIENATQKRTCQKCKGEGHYTHKFGIDNYQIVPCDFPGCHNGIVDSEENYHALSGKGRCSGERCNHTRKPEGFGTVESDLNNLVKECVRQVFNEKLLTDAFDPTSQGPNPTGVEDPYAAWNNKMRQMEEGEESVDEPTGSPYSGKKSDKKNYIPTVTMVKWAVKYLGAIEFKKRVKNLLSKSNITTEEQIAQGVEYTAREALTQYRLKNE